MVSKSEIIKLEYADLIKLLQEKVNFCLPQGEIFTTTDLQNYLIKINDLNIIQGKVRALKFIRDKYIAHNEHLLNNPDFNNFWDDVRFLQDVASLFVSIIGRYFLQNEYFQFYKTGVNHIHYSLPTDLWWIYETLEKVVEKENLIYWWDQGD